MQVNWSVMLNALLLMAVVFAISRMIKLKKQGSNPVKYRADGLVLGPKTDVDDIISVRKLDQVWEQESWVQREREPLVRGVKPSVYPGIQPRVAPDLVASVKIGHVSKPVYIQEKVHIQEKPEVTPSSIMVFLLAKANRQLAGYELLQTLLTTGLRFGEGNLFHRHQHANGQGPVLCSLAAATETGVFDLQNIGAFSVRGLCLFMQASGNPTIDSERLSILIDTGKQLSEGLDAHLLDDKRQPLSEESIQRYHQVLHLNQGELEHATV